MKNRPLEGGGLAPPRRPAIVAYLSNCASGRHRPRFRHPDEPESARRYARILCAYDASQAANRGLAEAIALALDQGAALRIVTIVEERPSRQALALETAGLFTAEYLDLQVAESRRILNQGLAMARSAGVEADGVSIRGLDTRSAERIVEEAAAWKADLIVMGTHGRRGLRRLVLGSDAEGVVRLAAVPVMLIRPTEQAPTGAE